jgi:histidinol-phosphate aminotransferase
MTRFIRTNIQQMAGYVPGEQPRESGIIKLNTNENPYPPSPRVFDALRAALTSDPLRKYPDPSGMVFRQTAARVLGVDPESILIGNGSDDSLTIITRAAAGEGDLVVAPSPSYLLYSTLAEIQGARFASAPFEADWTLPNPWPLPSARLMFLANPNSPSGTMCDEQGVRRLAESLQGILVVDEAYVDFAQTNLLALSRLPNVIVTRSLSKSYSLAGIRFGYAVAQPALVHELLKAKDSYNCDALSLAAATAALSDQDYLRETRRRIVQTRTRLAAALAGLGFTVTPSHANFLWCRRTDRAVRPIFEQLQARRILVRYMSFSGYGDGLRITIGTDGEMDRMLGELESILAT